ncbi:metallo-beta-lactamase domain protein [Colletotrichum musicola]|uniref:Metallo-beta-lactamase domain protein n=1 Tax=Colletotrichum musicola TaxID=2175873 RepID=A0A8H6NUA0_9PEZI|nr:metallo-beta-lactamase domain protein [Colletotrichum musicola]
MFRPLLLFFSLEAALRTVQGSAEAPLRVETFVHQDVSLNMVSSLVIGSEAAIIVDLPLTISSAESLILWVREKTEKPVVGMFASHNHPDHYLSARVCLDAFPNATFYASPTASEGIATGAPLTSAYWTSILSPSEIVQNASAPVPYNFTFFALPGDPRHPIHLIQPLTGDTVDETLFWLPSSRTLIAGDTVYGSQMHLFMADMLTPALTASWISTLDLLLALDPKTVIPGHSLSGESFDGAGDLDYTRKYLAFWQCDVESKGPDFYTPQELYALLNERFPGRLGATSQFLLNMTAENFGRGGTRFGHFIDFTAFDSREALDGWELQARQQA